MPEHGQATALITGAGSGLGEAMARRFAECGYRLAICDIDGQRAERVLEDLSAIAPGSFSQVLDVSLASDWDAAYQRVLTEWGSLNVLINNAGVAAAGNTEDTPLEDWRWVIDVDLMGVVLGCHRFLGLLREVGAKGASQCHIINVSSFAALAAMPGMSAYATAKAAVVAFSEQLRAELWESGVGVSVVCPAFVQTRLLESMRVHDQGLRDQVESWMRRSTVSADDVARQTMDAMASGRFLVLTHSITRRAWRFKRFFPEAYFRRAAQGSRRLANRRRAEQAS